MAKIIGLTGGIGSGKTTVMKFIESLGYKVYYADDAGKKVMQNKQIIQKVVSLLGDRVLCNDGSLNRKEIAEIVFKDSLKLSELNKIVHPAVAHDFENFVSVFSENEILIKESALLFETNANLSCDFVILITAPEEIRINRVVKRDGISEDEVKNRIRNQIPETIKMEKADFIVNNVNLNETFDDILIIFEKIKRM